MNALRTLLAGVLIISSSAASAAWSGPGWYLVVDSIAGTNGIFGNRFETFEACVPEQDRINTELKRLNAFADVTCKYVEQWMESDDPYFYK